MDYSLNSLNPSDFEQLVQALSKKILGNGAISFGDGPDGGREATFEGSAPYPSTTNKWSGYWVIQAKCKILNAERESTDFQWLKTTLDKEMQKYIEKKVRVPKNILFFTNIRLTAAKGSGTQDKASKLCGDYQQKARVKNVKIISYDDIRDFLDNYRDIATSYSNFILPGDVLQKLFSLLQSKEKDGKRVNQILSRFLEVEFRDYLPSRLEHAGKLTSNKINLERVFIDLKVSEITNGDNARSVSFVGTVIELSNKLNSGLTPVHQNRYVLVAGPGYGKSTLTQFVCQIHRVQCLKSLDTTASNLSELDEFLSYTKEIVKENPVSLRFPIQIALKDYAGWISERKSNGENISIIAYIKYRISLKTLGEEIEIDTVIDLIKTLPFIFIFDGLDEVPPSANRAEVLNEIKTFIDTDLRRFEANYIIIATTRPKGYSNDFDEKRFHHLTIRDLNYEDCVNYATRLLLNSVSEIDIRLAYLETIKRAYQDQVVGLLMKSPLQVSIMSILVQSGGEPPRNKYDLFNEYYSVVVRREKQKNVVKILNENSAYIEDIHNYLGYYLQVKSEYEEDASATITDEEFKNIVRKYIQEVICLEDNDKAERYINEIIDASKERIVFISEIEDKKIGFNIRSLQEYFAANYYLQHKTDDSIHDLLKQISLSSYWSNTFLFCLGYLAKHKRYMIYSVESTCNEFNGLTESKSLASICKFGSWLALDILNEGVFRSWPNHESKFIRFLDDLLKIPPISKHGEVTKLPSNIKIKLWEFILSKLKQPFEEQLTSWVVAGYLIQSDGLSNIKSIHKFWPQEVKNSTSLIKTLLDKGLVTNIWFIDKLLSVIKLNPPFTFYSELTSNRNSNMVHEIYSSHLLENESRSILLENLMFSIFISFGRHSGSRELIALAEDLVGGYDNNFEEFGRNEITISIITNYKVSLRKIQIENFEGFARIITHFLGGRAQYLIAILAFLTKPSKNGLLHLAALVNDAQLPPFILNIIRNLNWMFKKTLLNDGFSLNDIGESKEWIKYEKALARISQLKKLSVKKFDSIEFCGWSSSNRNLTKDSLREYYDNFYKYVDDYKQFRIPIMVELMKMIMYIGDVFFTDDEKLEPEIYSAIIDSTNELIAKGETGVVYRSLIPYLAILSIEDVERFSNINDHFLQNLEYEQYRFFYTSDIAVDKAFHNVSKIVERQCIMNNESNLISLLFSLSITKRLFSSNEDANIPFNILMNVQITNEKSRGYRDLLLMFDPNFSEEHYALIKLSIGNILKNNFMSLVYILNTEVLPNNLDFERLLIALYDSSSDQNELIQYLKDFIESKPSGLTPGINML
jgi:hypothetical protein